MCSALSMPKTSSLSVSKVVAARSLGADDAPWPGWSYRSTRYPARTSSSTKGSHMEKLASSELASSTTGPLERPTSCSVPKADQTKQAKWPS
ncbi:hypothetical protein VTN02DRAFT_5598 [Thermoascus thermophilus]